MALTHGNDPDALDAIGDVLLAQAERATSALDAGSVGLATLVDSWSGPDLDVFDSSWRVAERQIDAAAQLLRSVGERARDQAQQQRDASGGEGGGSGSAAPVADRTTPSPGGGSDASRALPPLDGDPTAATPVMHDYDVGGGGSPAVEELPVPYPSDTGDPTTDPGKRLWTPQGFAVTDDGKYAVTTFYDRSDTGSGMLAIQPLDGGPVKYVPIEGNDHFGGVAIQGDNVYVSGNGENEASGEDYTDGSYVQRYSLTELQNSPDGKTVHPTDGDVFKVPTGSTLTVHDDSLYVVRNSWEDGGDNGPRVYEYELGEDGALPADGTESTDDFEAPKGVQGVTTPDGENFYYVRSHGFDEPSDLVHAHRKYPYWPQTMDSGLPPVSQGIDIHDGRFVITNESAAPGVSTADEPEYRDEIEAEGLTPDDTLREYDVPSETGPHYFGPLE